MNINIRNVELGKPLYFVIKKIDGFEVSEELDWYIIISKSGMIFKRKDRDDSKEYILSQDVFRNLKEATRLSNRLNKDNGFKTKKKAPTCDDEILSDLAFDEEIIDDADIIVDDLIDEGELIDI